MPNNKANIALAEWKRLCETIKRETTVNKQESLKDKNARIERAKNDYAFFVEYYFPHYATSKCADFHIRAANKIKKNKRIRAVLEWARGHAKSTHIDIMIPMWLKMQNELHVMVLVGKSETQAKILLGDIQAELQYNERYSHDYGDQYNQGNWEDGTFVTKDNCAFFSRGRGQSPRGLRYRDKRPDYIALDDVDDDELVNNESRIRRLMDWILEALFNCMDMGRGRFIAAGNRIHKNSIIANLAKVSGIYHSVINALDAKGQPSWKEKYTITEILDVINTIGYRRAQKEFFNNPITEGTIFKLSDIRYRLPESFAKYKYLVCYTDPSFKSGTKNDYKATILIGQRSDKSFDVLKAYVEQTTPRKMVLWHYDIHDLVQDKHVVSYYMEANFIQDLLLDEFITVGKELGWMLPVKGDLRVKPDKYQRIENLQPLFERGLFYFNDNEKNDPHMIRLIDQFLLFEKGSKSPDDGPDAVEGAIFIINSKNRNDYTKISLVSRNETGINRYRF